MKNKLKYYLDRFVDKLIFAFRNFFKTKKGKIVLLDYTPYSGSNTYALYQYIKSIGYNDVELVEFKDVRFSKLGFKKYFEKVKKILSAEVVITTHDVIFYKDNQHLIQLWHGIPLKAMGLLDKTLNLKRKRYTFDSFNKYDYVISTSDTYNTLLNACTGYVKGNYCITGLPRNDYLFKKGKLEKLYDVKKYKKIIMFIPTFRKGYAQKEEGNNRNNNIFGFDSFNFKKFCDFLKHNEFLFVAKLHPFEENYYKELYKGIESENFVFLSIDELSKNKIDLYEILKDADLLITDYSSVYFDFLLTDKPIIFINNDIEKYEQNRGFLLYPYDFWTPGPKVKMQDELENMIKFIFEKDDYKEHRRVIRDIVFKYKDDKASQRIWSLIKDILGV